MHHGYLMDVGSLCVLDNFFWGLACIPVPGLNRVALASEGVTDAAAAASLSVSHRILSFVYQVTSWSGLTEFLCSPSEMCGKSFNLYN